MIQRRRALLGLGAALFAPTIIRTPGLLMPVKAAPPSGYAMLDAAGRVPLEQLPQWDLGELSQDETVYLAIHWRGQSNVVFG